MSDSAIYQDADITITSTQFVYQSNHYPLQSIKNVVWYKEPLHVRGLVINILLAAFAVLGISTFEVQPAVVGLLMAAVSGSNLYGLYHDIHDPVFVVAVEFHSNESIRMKRRSLEWARGVYDALHVTMRR